MCCSFEAWFDVALLESDDSRARLAHEKRSKSVLQMLHNVRFASPQYEQRYVSSSVTLSRVEVVTSSRSVCVTDSQSVHVASHEVRSGR